MMLTTGHPPRIFTRGDLRVRDTLIDLFEQYFQNDGPATGSQVTKGRYDLYIKNDMALNEIARLDLIWPTSNVVLTSFGPHSKFILARPCCSPSVMKSIMPSSNLLPTRKIQKELKTGNTQPSSSSNVANAPSSCAPSKKPNAISPTPLAFAKSYPTP
ncbi:uncharacterized protein BCR38DRAFT_481882 [Pseudomassariella vexata]|uniref:Uncharacterized protein n=1 Tax=Pseudomassariella vexata TaxID=1141098 RepID=A0A1Y2E9Y3_9PEZI|nr:uncharacterized protein BCR38DRAFT_481882 [Pseudomassariella vexata]ORY68390.1 hypothetical protein BCR38DRAFT_481882 [Pseudomassariella vexata]